MVTFISIMQPMSERWLLDIESQGSWWTFFDVGYVLDGGQVLDGRQVLELAGFLVRLKRVVLLFIIPGRPSLVGGTPLERGVVKRASF